MSVKISSTKSLFQHSRLCWNSKTRKKNVSQVLHQDINVWSFMTFLVKHTILILEFPPFTPDLALYDFFLSFKIVRIRVIYIDTNTEGQQRWKFMNKRSENGLGTGEDSTDVGTEEGYIDTIHSKPRRSHFTNFSGAT